MSALRTQYLLRPQSKGAENKLGKKPIALETENEKLCKDVDLLGSHSDP